MKQKVVFLDRDGVLNRERGDYTWKPEDVDINEGVVEALQHLRDSGFNFIVISNQSGIAKGIYKHQDVKAVNRLIKEFLSEFQIRILDFYYCPHHPTKSKCLCRKPDSLLLERAVAKYQIDVSQSWFIGDMERDREAGEKIGLNTLLIEANSDLSKQLEPILKAQ